MRGVGFHHATSQGGDVDAISDASENESDNEFGNNVSIEDIGPEDSTSINLEQVKVDFFDDDNNIVKIRSERDAAFKKIAKLEKIICDMNYDDKYKDAGGNSDKVGHTNRGLKQEINVNLNGTNVKINIEIGDAKENYPKYAEKETNETTEENLTDVDDLLSITNDEEKVIDGFELDDSLLDDPDEPL